MARKGLGTNGSDKRTWERIKRRGALREDKETNGPDATRRLDHLTVGESLRIRTSKSHHYVH